MSDRSIDRITFLLNANREAGRKLQEQFQRHGQEHDKAKAEQARLDEIAATQRKHAEEAVDVVMRAGAVNRDRAWKIVHALLDAHFMAHNGKVPLPADRTVHNVRVAGETSDSASERSG
jgi:hypothetical protein